MELAGVEFGTKISEKLSMKTQLKRLSTLMVLGFVGTLLSSQAVFATPLEVGYGPNFEPQAVCKLKKTISWTVPSNTLLTWMVGETFVVEYLVRDLVEVSTTETSSDTQLASNGKHYRLKHSANSPWYLYKNNVTKKWEKMAVSHMTHNEKTAIFKVLEDPDACVPSAEGVEIYRRFGKSP